MMLSSKTLCNRLAAAGGTTAARGSTRAPLLPLPPQPPYPSGRARLHRRRNAGPAPPPPAAAPQPPPSAADSTDLDAEATAVTHDLGVYAKTGAAALHVGFQGPGWRMERDPATGYVYSLVDFCSPGRARLAFGAAAGADDDGEPAYDWGRGGWGGAGGLQEALRGCLGSSLGDEKPRFYLSARQVAEILAAPGERHSFGARGCRRGRARCTRWEGADGQGGAGDCAVGSRDETGEAFYLAIPL